MHDPRALDYVQKTTKKWPINAKPRKMNNFLKKSCL